MAEWIVLLPIFLVGVSINGILDWCAIVNQNFVDCMYNMLAEFEQQLEDYVAKYPHVKLCDPPRATMLLRNRQSMLDVIAPGGFDVFAPKDGSGLGGGDAVLGHARCSVPRHTVLKEGCSFDEALGEIRKCKLKYPIVAKSLWADGRPGSHDIAVIWSGMVVSLDGVCIFMKVDMTLKY